MDTAAGPARVDDTAADVTFLVRAEVEGQSQQVEDGALAVLQRLNSVTGDLNITLHDEMAVAAFAAAQAQRVPGQRRAAQEVVGAMAKLHLEANIPTAVEEAKATGRLAPDVTLDEVRRALPHIEL